MNPDGFENSMIGSCSGVTGRSNMNDVDLNRDFPTWDDKGYGNISCGVLSFGIHIMWFLSKRT